jgi:FKBP-type peptidyl-prolyl cis-trans isomerase FkpA
MLALGALPALTSGCTEAPATPSISPSFSQTDLRVGTGADAATGAQVSVNYTGWLYDSTRPDSKGLQFDTSVGKQAFSFSLGTSQVIQGWEKGVPGMKVGGLRRLVVPPSLAYGATRSGAIPPNATLVFDIELLSVP